MTITHDALDLTAPHTPPDMGHGGPVVPALAPTGDIWWPLLETCLNLFMRPHCTGPPLVLTSGSYQSIYIYVVDKRVVRIPLEYFLVSMIFVCKLSFLIFCFILFCILPDFLFLTSIRPILNQATYFTNPQEGNKSQLGLANRVFSKVICV